MCVPKTFLNVPVMCVRATLFNVCDRTFAHYLAHFCFILFAENSQILLKISLNFYVSGSTESVSKQPTQLIVELKSSLWQKLGTLGKDWFQNHVRCVIGTVCNNQLHIVFIGLEGISR